MPFKWSFMVLAVVLALVCGAVGALIVFSLNGRIGLSASALLAFVGWTVTLVGWFISARLSSRAQERMFLNSLINTARVELVELIRIEQDWAQSLWGLAFRFKSKEELNQLLSTPKDPLTDLVEWHRRMEEALDLLHNRRQPRRSLIMLLEEYELVFPDTKGVRRPLAERSRSILERCGDAITDLVYKRAEAIQKLENMSGELADYIALLEDLRVHIQNASLSEITGRRSPVRQPPDPNVPRMITNAEGQLEVVVPAGPNAQPAG